MSAGGILAVVAAPVVALSIPSFTSGEWIAIIGAVGLVLTNVITSMRIGQKADEAVAKTEKVMAAVVGTETSQGVLGKLDQIHDVSNSTLGEVRAELKTIQAINAKQQEIIMDLQNERNKKLEAEAMAAAKEPVKK